MFHDLVIVGSGPSSYGYLLGLPPDAKSVAVVTSTALPHSRSDIHPKLHDGRVTFIDRKRGRRYGPTANIGGLSASWGGILAIPDEGEMERFERRIGTGRAAAAFRAILSNLALHFRIFEASNEGFEEIKCASLVNPKASQKFVMTGRSRHAWERSGISLAALIKSLVVAKGAEWRVGTVEGLYFDKPSRIWTLQFRDGSILRTKKLVLAAGGLGNLNLLQQLLPYAALSTVDHVPLQVYCLRLPWSNDFANFSGSATPLCYLYSSKKYISAGYCLGWLSSDFRKKMKLAALLQKVLPKKVFNYLYLVQVWHKSLTVELGPQSHTKPPRRMEAVRLLVSMLTEFLSRSLVPVFVTRTSPGEGFHYMSVRPQSESDSQRDILWQLKNDYAHHLEILGGLTVEQIMVEHPSLYFMADAYAKAAWRS